MRLVKKYASVAVTHQAFLLLAQSATAFTASFPSAPATRASYSQTTCLAMSQPKTASYGAWESPITSKSLTTGSVRFGGLHYDDTADALYLLEGRPQEGGRNVLCQLKKNTEHDGGCIQKVDVTPQESNVRTRVHEYGGAALTFAATQEQQEGTTAIYFSEFKTQQLCRLDTASGKSTPLTPDDNRFRFADGVVSQKSLYCIREDHEKPEPVNVVNQIIQMDLNNNNQHDMTVLATGRDFYAAPRVSPDGTQLAYIAWDHPNMPWDATELRVTRLDNNDDDGTTTSSSSSNTQDHTLVAGEDQDTSVLQPLWHPTTGDLYYISDQSGYYNIYKYSPTTGSTECVLPMPYDFGGSAPGWGLGQQGFRFLKDGRLVASYTREGRSVLLVATLPQEGKCQIQEYGIDDGLPMQLGSVIPGKTADDVYFLGGSPSTPTSVYHWNLKEKKEANVLASSSTVSFDEGMISTPQQIEFPTANDLTAFGYYYPPQNSNFQAPEGTAPPLLVKAHGGPTACTGTSFNAGIQFWTSRGFAVLDVDYGGSTGYGRDYRRRLRGNWGITDIQDVCAGAEYLVKEGKANPKQLCIDGGSAGGYTTLGALAFRDVFQAGCSLYGVGDLTALAGDTHKFESRYLDGLVGKYPEEKALYKERSPIESVETLSCPILLLQGDEDKIVPPNQAEMMHESLLKKGIPTCLKIYKGEQHGFRKAENIEDALDSELAFYGKVFGIKVPGAIDLAIDNM